VAVSVEIKMQHLDGVATDDLVERLVVKINGHVADELFGVWPC
jgi:hypothetical protein